MAGLKELAAALLGANTQKEIAAENPYYSFASVPAMVGQTASQMAIKDPKRYGMKETLPYVIGSGLLQGILTGAGDRYQNTLTNRYADVIGRLASGQTVDQEASGLSSGLFGSASRTGTLLKVQKGLEDRTTLFNALAKANTPRQREMILQSAAQTGMLPEGMTAPAARGVPVATQASEGTTETRGLEGQILDEVSAEANKLMDAGAEPPQAFTTAREAFKTKREELDRQYKRIEEAEKSASEMKTLTEQLRLAAQDAGNTGVMGGWAQTLAGVRQYLNNEDQKKKYAAGQTLEAKRNDIIGIKGRAFKGPMSDADVRIMLSSMPSLTNEEEVNTSILDSWDYVANLQSMYVDFMREAQAQGVPVSKAEAAWKKIKEENPYIIKEKGQYKINPNWIGGGSAEVETTDAAPIATGGDVQTQYNELRAQGLTAEQAKAQLGL